MTYNFWSKKSDKIHVKCATFCEYPIPLNLQSLAPIIFLFQNIIKINACTVAEKNLQNIILKTAILFSNIEYSG